MGDGRTTMRRPPRPYAAAILVPVIAVSYAVLAAAAIVLTRRAEGIALMWLANGPLIAALATRERRHWPALITAALVGSVCASLAVSPLSRLALLFAVANVGEAVIAALLLRRLRVERQPFASVRSIALFVGCTVCAAPLISGLVACTVLRVFQPLTPASTLFDWALGHGVGNLIATPLPLLFGRRNINWRRFRLRTSVGHAVGCALLIAATTCAVFAQDELPLLFLPIAPLLVATFALQRFGASGGVLIIALVADVMTLQGHGPMMLIHGDESARLQFLQFYLAVLFLTVLPVAATLWQRDKLTDALAESEARYRMLADNATDIMLTLAPNGTIRFASPAIRELGYYEPDALIGRNASELVHEADRERVSAVHVAALQSPDRIFKVDYRAVRADGSIGWFETHTRAVAGSEGPISAVISVIRGLDERKQREAELERAATTDPLTGLLNRAALRRIAKEAIAAARGGTPSTLAVLDLDHFKAINDNWGHSVGDDALLMVADLLREHVRAGDAIGRIGGEEFVVLFRGLAASAAAPVCDRLRILLAERPVPGAGIRVTMSAGLAEICPGLGLDAVYAAADRALYRAKARGRNRIMVESDPFSG